MKKKPQSKKQPNPYAIFAINTFQMGISIFLFVQIGKYLDNKFGFDETLKIVFAILGFIIGFFLSYKTIKKINKKA